MSINSTLLAAVRRAAEPSDQHQGLGVTDGNFEQGNSAMRERSEMMKASDDTALSLVVAADLDKPAATEVWQERWKASPSLQSEFPAMADYAACMNRDLIKKRKVAAQSSYVAPSADLSSTGLNPAEIAVIENVRAAGMDRAAMVAAFHSHWRATPALRAEFNTADFYATFMVAAEAGRFKIHRGKIR